MLSKGIKRDLCFVVAYIYYSYYKFMIHQSCNSCQKGNEVVLDAWLIEILVHTDTCRLPSFSFYKCLQSGPLKIHWRLMWGIIFETTSFTQFWELKWYFSDFHVSLKISGLSIILTVIDQAWRHELIVSNCIVLKIVLKWSWFSCLWPFFSTFLVWILFIFTEKTTISSNLILIQKWV